MEEFIVALKDAINSGIFVKLTLSRARQAAIKNIYYKLVVLKKGTMLNATYRKETQDITKNYEVETGIEQMLTELGGDFGQVILFTLKEDLHVRVSPNGQIKIKHFPPTFSQIPPQEHDKVKQRPIDVKQDFLYALGITNEAGKVKADMQSKFRQINRFVELLTPYLNELKKDTLKLVDMGSGKGYLTFAIYDYLLNKQGRKVEAVGVELRPNLVALGNEVAKDCGFDQLQFVENSIEDFKLPEVDILIALHACNTASDDALYKGIQAGAALIVVAPCCHKQIRQDLNPSNCLQSITKYGILKERQAELLTDTLRALLLEVAGYKTSVVEFISSEHTAKNLLIIAEKRASPMDTQVFQEQIEELKQLFGISQHYLEQILHNKK